jgi:ergothioneine biosynthesis protein EgtB
MVRSPDVRRSLTAIDPSASRSERFASIRSTTRTLAAPLSAEDCAIQSMPDASPVKWHLAHTTWVFETFLLSPNLTDYQVFDPAYRYLFNSYYNAIGERHPRPERGMLARPELAAVLAYRDHVDEAMQKLLSSPRFSQQLGEAFELGLNHEQQHQELILMDAKHLLSRNPLNPVYQKRWPLTAVRAREHEWLAFGPGLHDIGYGGSGFRFDNETPRHHVWLDIRRSRRPPARSVNTTASS